MPSIFLIDGIKGYVYDEIGERHNMPHFHAYYAEFAAEIYMDGTVRQGDMPSAQLKKIRDWLQDGGASIVEAKWKELNQE